MVSLSFPHLGMDDASPAHQASVHFPVPPGGVRGQPPPGRTWQSPCPLSPAAVQPLMDTRLICPKAPPVFQSGPPDDAI